MPASAVGERAVELVVRRAEIGWEALTPAAAAAARDRFADSCTALMRREDLSGLTRAGDWDAACAAVNHAAWRADPRGFFATHFTPVRVGDGQGLVTGYYEPELAGSLTPQPGYVPIYRAPPDLVQADLGAFSTSLKGRTIRGRVVDGQLVPYDDRATIENGSLAGKGLEIAYTDPVELFFLQVQGSGRLRLPDGRILRLGYATQNGHGYVGIGKLLRERGELASGQATMQGLKAWLRADPARGLKLMQENPSYVFFRLLDGPGPLGALGVPVVGYSSIAADPKFVPLGAPIWLTHQDANLRPLRLWVAQDTGGAIKGPNRFDSFWGAGALAEQVAGGMSSRGDALILLPHAAAARFP